MGRIVWFEPPVVSGFGFPAAAFVFAEVAIIAIAFWVGRKTVKNEQGRLDNAAT